MSTVKLITFPYAGGSAAVYSNWKNHLPPGASLEVLPFELSGRGKRMREPLYPDLDAAVDDVYANVRGLIAGGPYALFGHSLGALLTFALATRIRQMGDRPPLHLFFSGRGAPGVKPKEVKMYHRMSADEFKREVIELGGTPPEFFRYPELMNIYLPVLRNDFRLAETDLSDRKVVPFAGDLTVFLGKEDHEILPVQAEGWKRHATGTCSLHYFDGDHFFIRRHEARIVGMIAQTLHSYRTTTCLSL